MSNLKKLQCNLIYILLTALVLDVIAQFLLEIAQDLLLIKNINDILIIRYLRGLMLFLN